MAPSLRKKRVAIVGGGPGGATTAMILAGRGLEPVVLEAQPGPEFKVGECLSPGANPLLERLGIKDRLSREGHLPSYGNRSVWGSVTPLDRDFLFGTRGSGWHLDRRKFEATMADAARDVGVDWRYGWRLVKCSPIKGGWELNVKTPGGSKSLEAEFVVDATGRQARLARQFGVHQIRYDRLTAIALLLESQHGKEIIDSFTLVEAVASGWWYSARLPDAMLITVYLTDSDLVDQAVMRQAEGLFSLLEETVHTRRRISEGGYRPLAQPRLLPANSSRLSAIYGDGWLAVGDAAAAYDPLSSYGISSAMGAGFYAGSAIADFLAGNRSALLAYKEIVGNAYAQYIIMHCDQYALERRWADNPFWCRRHRSIFGRETEE
jgi:flavin-dependent dehydrogenase